jgi:heterodisulfide reductase subunit A
MEEYTKDIPNVVHVEKNVFLCSSEGQQLIQDRIIELGLTRVVAAACTPRTHEPIFQESCELVGLNPYLFEMVNVRDQCSWVHTNVPAEATQKAKDLVKMGVARSRNLQPLRKETIPIDQSTLVIGGGIAGMTAALQLENQGMKVYLIEREDRLGGRLNELTKVYPADLSATDLAKAMAKKVDESRIETMMSTEIESITGFVGNFDVITDKGRLRVGTIVAATGADVYSPDDEFGFNRYRNVITNQELEKFLHDSDGTLKIGGNTPKTVVFIQCVGSRNPEKNPGCARYCCPTTIKQAVRLRKDGANVAVFHRDMRTVGARAEEQYRQARSLGVKFIRYTPERLPRVYGNGDHANSVEILELALNRTLELNADLIVLASSMIPNKQSSDKLHDALKVPLGADGFFMERHAKLGPVESTSEGVFLAGCVSGPKDISDSIAQGAAAAAKAASIICRDTVSLEPTTCTVDQALCRACGKCVEICQYHAPELVEVVPGLKAAEVNQALCKGCGTCACWCPTGAIAALHFTDDQINSMMEALLAGKV